MTSQVSLSIATALLLASAASASGGAKQPVYIYLFSRFSDFVNIGLTETRIRQVLPLIEKYRRDHPELSVSATVLFSGALSQAIDERNSRTGLKDYILDYSRRGVIDVGYDGADEPTYHRRPRPEQATGATPEQRWLARGEAIERFLTESRDLFGQVQSGRSGGLKAMQEVFGEAACITGLTRELGSDSDLVHRLHRYNRTAIMWGLPDPDPARNIHGYRGSAEAFGYFMSPAAHFSPELNWVDNVLRSSETSDAAIRVVSAMEGPEGLKGVLEKIDRKHVRIVHVELGDVRIYLSDFYRSGAHYPPLRLAYDHPDRPNLPAEALGDEKKEVAAALEKQQSALEWMAAQFLPANPGSRFVSSADLKRMVKPAIGSEIDVAGLKNAVPELLKTWASDTYLPNYLAAGGRYLSLADTFYVLASVLAEEHGTGRRPEKVRLAAVYGPLDTHDDHGPALGAVTPAAVARVCSTLVGRLNDSSWKPLPGNIIPTWVEVDGLRVNAAQFLRLMLESLVAPSRTARIQVKMTNLFSAAGLVYPRMRPDTDQGATWTFRPAPLHAGQPALGSQR